MTPEISKKINHFKKRNYKLDGVHISKMYGLSFSTLKITEKPFAFDVVLTLWHYLKDAEHTIRLKSFKTLEEARGFAKQSASEYGLTKITEDK